MSISVTFTICSLGGRTSDTIVSWLEKKTGPPAKTLATVEEAEEFVKPLGVAVIGFFEDETSEAAKAFLLAAGESATT